MVNEFSLYKGAMFPDRFDYIISALTYIIHTLHSFVYC